ncbi:MAG TPA: hypothetical protein VK801_04545 [Caulobacteraceae bacterium]|jgi:hypothetical protein|nr:hypothetical protein [Caulobacteraceae bacterium]
MRNDPAPSALTEVLRSQLLSECHVMVSYALSSGRELPTPVLEVLDALEGEPELGLELPILAGIYGQLLQITTPATPLGLRMLQEDRHTHRWLHAIGPLPSIRHLIFAAVFFSVLFFGVSLLPEINANNVNQDIYESAGFPLAAVLVFLLSAAGLGATFSSLFDAYELVAEGRYDTRYDSLYWARIGLGLISGLMLSELVPQGENAQVLTRPLLALVGGFSSSVVHRILQRFVETLENLFTPTPQMDPAVNERVVRDRLAEQQGLQRAAMAKAFDQVLDQYASSGDIGEARKSLVEIVSGRTDALAAVASIHGSLHRRVPRSPAAAPSAPSPAELTPQAEPDSESTPAPA